MIRVTMGDATIMWKVEKNMKKTVIYLIIAMSAFVLCGCSGGTKPAGEAPSSEKLLGGWEITAHDSGELPEDAQKAFDKANQGTS